MTLSLLLVLVLIVIFMIGFEYLEVMELKARDFRFKLRGPIEPGPEVVLAVVDEKSLDRIGRWPWPRSKIADLIRVLDEDGAKVIGFDIVFGEPDKNTNMELIRRLEGEINRRGLKNKAVSRFLAKELELADNDLILAKTIAEVKTPVVLGYFLRIERDKSVAHITPEQIREQLKNAHYTFARLSSPNVELDQTDLAQAFMPVANILALSKTAASSGFMNMFQDIDGTVRWIPMVIRLHDKYYLPLSLQKTLRFYLDDAPASTYVSEVGVEKVMVGKYELPTDELGRYLVNYRGPSYTFPHYSIADILEKRFKPGTFKNKIILTGATAVGVYDMRTTPFETNYPGLEVHANVIDSILRQDFLVRPQWTTLLDIGMMIVAAVILGLVLPKISAVVGVVFGLGLLMAEGGLNYLFFSKGIWLNLIFPSITVILVYTGITAFRYITEEREKKKIKGAFQTYLHPSVVNEVLKNPDMLKLGGQKKVLTVLFSDIKGFTTISENMDPEALVHLLNEYLTAMTDLVFKYDGLLDKYEGDAVMAIWGAPLDLPDHPLKACRTGLEMLSELQRLREQWAQEDPAIPNIDIRIGLNTGLMVVGNIGSETRFDYTVIGDEVNLGSRLEGASKEYGTNIIISETTYEHVKDVMLCRELDLVAVKGKSQPVRIFELIGENGKVPQEKIELVHGFTQGLRAYQTQQWDKGKKIFSEMNALYPEDEPTKLFLRRVVDLKKNPPPKNWDGVFVMTTK
ncbi:MAG: adenylate/guanylate cyclase domain-containing protein [Deltaproteobacteria bacterium]|nr:adenylate/guanylate cyclase domain-containing protein [Deltaproteobacteria bacterium]